MRSIYLQNMTRRGYRQDWPQEPYILTRREGTVCYIVLLTERPASAELLRSKRRMLEDFYRQQGCETIRHLCVVIQKDGMFSEDCLRLTGTAENVWLYAEDQGRVYRYENQPEEFDGLARLLESVKPVDGGRMFTPRTAPWVTLALILINAGCFVIPLLTGQDSAWIQAGMDSRELVFGQGEWYRLFTSMFLHGSWSHLLNNMLVLAVLGLYLEPALGHLRYGLIYLASGAAAGLFSAWIGYAEVGSVGASGAIFGLSGALLAIVLFERGRIPSITPRRVIYMCIASLYSGFTAINVDNAAHIGGLAAGFLLLLLTRKI